MLQELLEVKRFLLFHVMLENSFLLKICINDDIVFNFVNVWIITGSGLSPSERNLPYISDDGRYLNFYHHDCD